MLWLLVSGFFLWCAYREVRSGLYAPLGLSRPFPISRPYLAIVLALAGLFAWPPVYTRYFEWFLSRRASVLADGRHASVHCNTVWDTMLDAEMLAAGHANIATGEIGIQHPWCNTLRAYLHHPAHANSEELWALALFTHESMHVRGEDNEARTECEAVQRNFRAAKLLGVPADIAGRNALEYYHVIYQERGRIGGMQAAYYSSECAPGGALDEHLEDSTWGQEP
jgi:hypothetical protein